MLLEVMLVATEVAWAEQERRQSDHTLRLSVPTMDLKYGHMRLPTLCLPTLQLEDRSLLLSTGAPLTPWDMRKLIARKHCVRTRQAQASIGVPHYWHQLSVVLRSARRELQANGGEGGGDLPDALRMPVAALPTRSTT